MTKIVNCYGVGFEFKKYPIVSDPKPVLVSRTFQLFDITQKVLLKEEEFIADFLTCRIS